MSTTTITLGLAIVMVVGLVVGLGVVSLLSGAFSSMFAHNSRFIILKSQKGSCGLAFTFRPGDSDEDSKFNTLHLRLFNPHGSPTQVELVREFDQAGGKFSRDVDLGPGFLKLLKATKLDQAQIQFAIASNDGVVTYDKTYRALDFLRERDEATKFVAESVASDKPKQYYQIPKRSFISDPLPEANKTLKIATNPEFAGQFAPAGDVGAIEENFSLSKVWIDPGCIVCDACETIYPEVFEVLEDTCIVRPEAPLDDGLKVAEAAEACPVEVIKFNKV